MDASTKQFSIQPHIMDGIIETSRLARKAYEYSDYIVVITVVH